MSAFEAPPSDLDAPLGVASRAGAASKAARRAKRSGPVPWTAIFGGGAVLIGAGIAFYITAIHDPRQPDIVALSPITRKADIAEGRAPEPVRDAPPAERTSERSAGELSGQNSATDIEAQSGVSVVRGGNASAPGSVVIQVPQTPQAVKLAAAPDKRLIDRSRHGILPKIGSDGAKPSQVYARPVTGQQGKPRIAILIGGMGISQAATSDAIAKLPGAVSLAYAPYAGDLERQVSRARADGHEVLLQIPMEPFDYPENDPGPHTLRAGDEERDNIDRLHWLMSRFTGYVGVMNFMGAKFTSSDAALKPVLAEFAQRGLLFIDDGSSNRSRVPDLSGGLRLEAGRADSVLDAVASPDAIDRELARLEALARERGSALGSANALPLTIERVTRWARGLESRGILLVPVSNALASARRS